MNRTHGAALAAILLVSVSGCSNHQVSAATDSPATGDTAAADAAPAAGTTAAADAAPVAVDHVTGAGDSSDEKAGSGHLSLTGDFPIEKDFVVSACQVGPPGDGLLSGYRMMSKDGAAPIGLVAVTLKEYLKDGPYDQQNHSAEAAAGETINLGSSSGLTLMIMRDSNAPLAFGQVPDSKLTITISDNGSTGDAEFANLQSQPLTEKMDPKSGTMAGDRVSGSLKWTCGTVGRMNAKMNDAVNGMFKTLIPPK